MRSAVVAAALAAMMGSASAARPLLEDVSLAVRVRGNATRSLKNIAPGCKEACCYDPDWWLNTRPAPIVTCLEGGDNPGYSADSLAQACEDGTFPGVNDCITTGTGATICGNQSQAKCRFEEAQGENVNGDMMPCRDQEWNGQTFTVYDPVNIKAGNNEIVWACAEQPEGGPAGVQACNQPNDATYNRGASYAKTWGWNIGGQFKAEAKIFDTITSGFTVTGGYTRTETKTDTASVTATAKPGEHACVTKGTLIHHGWGTMFIDSVGLNGDGCKKWKVDNWATDAPINDKNNPDYATSQEWGTEVKPCGYPLISGAT